MSFRVQIGFTLIELLITIAIIGILVSVIVPRLNDAREKGKETKIMAEVEAYHKRAMAEGVTGSTYDVVCGSNSFATSSVFLNGANSLYANSNQFVCNSSADAFAISAELSAGKHWCGDSTGIKKELANPLDPGDLVCP